MAHRGTSSTGHVAHQDSEVESASAIVAALLLSHTHTQKKDPDPQHYYRRKSLMPQGTDPKEYGPICFTPVFPKESVKLLEIGKN